MRRAIARGRVFPQSYSTDRRYGRLSLKACALFPLMWANADDQGRLCGDPEEIKYATCPNIDHITKADIPGLLEELNKNTLIKVYSTSKTEAIQILDWWDVHRPQWAWPSQYPPPEGWQDHLRYKKGAKEVVTESWPVSGETKNSTQVITRVSNKVGSGEQSQKPLTTPSENERGKRKEETERGNSPERSGEKPTPPPAATLNFYIESFQKAWGREPNTREAAQLRDLEKEISSAGGTPEQIHEAFKEAAFHNKLHISYVRAVLLDWLGIARGPP
ncbi:hypothetical protein ES705_46133 [subsurface metagenome]